MVFRKRVTNGIWCTALLPTILLLEYYKEPIYHWKNDKMTIFCSISLSILSLIVYCKFVFPAVDNQLCYGVKSNSVFRYAIKYIFYDMFERKLSSIVRKLRTTSSKLISSKLQPSTIQEARRIREYTKRIKKNSTSNSPFVDRLIPGEDKKRSLERKIPGSGVEPIIESVSLRNRKKSSLVEIIKGSIVSNVSSPTHLLVTPDDEIYTKYLESMTSESNRRFFNVTVTIMTLINTSFGWIVLEDKIGFYIPACTFLGCYCYVYFLPILFLTFRNVFTFGEGCLIIQSCIIFTISTINDIESTTTAKTTDAMMLLLIGKCYLLAIVLCITLPLMFRFRLGKGSKVIWFSFLGIGVGISMIMLFWKLMSLNAVTFTFKFLPQ